MIIELQNFGPIKSFKFDTDKDIHAIFGKNNIGKSYAISAVYLILKGLREYEYDDGFSSTIPNISDTTNINKFVEKQFKEKKIDEFDIKQEISNRFTDSLNSSLMLMVSKSFQNTFQISKIENLLSKNPIKILISLNICSISIELDSENRTLKVYNSILSSGFKIISSDSQKKPELVSDVYTFYYYKNQDSEYNLMGLDRILSVLHLKIWKEIKLVTDNIYYLPASRSGLYNSLNSFGPIFAEISRNRFSLSSKFEIPNLPEPISDYFLKLNNIENTTISDIYTKNFEQIEKDILKGSITFDYETKKYFYTPSDTDFHLELSSTSSMISEIAPIIAHLKYIIPLENETPSILYPFSKSRSC